MANEITVIGQAPNGSFVLFFRYDIVTPITVGGVNVVPTPATPEPSVENPTPTAGDSLSWVVRQVITQQEITDLDAGDSAYEIKGFHPADGMTNPQMIAKGKEIYAVTKAEYLATYNIKYANAGIRIDEV